MDTAVLVAFAQETLFLSCLFIAFLAVSMWFGRQTITNLILGIYFAFLFSLKFPYYAHLQPESVHGQAAVAIGLFLLFVALATTLFTRIMPREYSEKALGGLWKKILLAAAATVLVTAFSYHALPVTDFITPGSPVQSLFGSERSFFWWLLAPLVVLFIT